MKPIVYISSPYTQGNTELNVKFQLFTFDRIMKSGMAVPIAPLWSHFQHTVYPQEYDTWMDYDRRILSTADALVRLPAFLPEYDYFQASSKGCDMEWEEAFMLDIPCLRSLYKLYEWVQKVWNQSDDIYL